MKCKTRAAALLMSAAMVFSLAACGADTSRGAEHEGNKMSAGVYILSEIDAYYDALDKAPDGVTSPKDVMKAQIDGKTGSQFITERAVEYVKQFYTIEKLFNEKGLTFSEDTEQNIVKNTDYLWEYSQEFYERNGISKQAVSTLNQNLYKSDMLFFDLYGEGGERTVGDSEIEDYYVSTRARVRYIPFAFFDQSKMEMLPDEEKAKVEEKANSYFERAKAGEDMNDLIAEYETEQNGGTAPHEHTPGMHDAIIKETSLSPSSDFVKEMFSAPIGEVKLFSDSTSYYVAVKVDPLADDRSDFEGNHAKLLQEMKKDEFDEYLLEQSKDVQVTFNDAAIKRYTPEKLKFDEPEE